MKIARDWLHCTPDEAADRLTNREFREIYAEYLRCPWGDYRTDLQIGWLAYHLVSCHVRHPERLKLSNYIPPWDDWNRRKELPTKKELQSKLFAWAKQLGPKQFANPEKLKWAKHVKE